MSRLRSRSAAVWKYFEIESLEDKKAVCNYCKKTLSYKSTITNLKLHLKQKHIGLYTELCVSEAERTPAPDHSQRESHSDTRDEESDSTVDPLIPVKRETWRDTHDGDSDTIYQEYEVVEGSEPQNRRQERIEELHKLKVAEQVWMLKTLRERHTTAQLERQKAQDESEKAKIERETARLQRDVAEFQREKALIELNRIKRPDTSIIYDK